MEKQFFIFRLYKIDKDKNQSIISEVRMDASGISDRTKTKVNIKEKSALIIDSLRTVLKTQTPKTNYYVQKFAKWSHDKRQGVNETILTDKHNQFKFGLYTKHGDFEHIIIEREFAAFNYNPAVRLSFELAQCINEICDDIMTHIIEEDRVVVNEDFILLEYNPKLNYDSLRKMDLEERVNKLKKINPSYQYNQASA